ncbi:hypothetical protein VR7878_03215 [Vibrio ruber DSM 16370]|uniref:Lipoprotein n=1 Tax=Vibrio ruber (strain DSM 16370 / JCM 11486 / BCRC 17186 / CECT 7878 / LMG 23124 / VR1) TaxID=1123498 RepID=A0A1R4LR59_VIBR1|nr:hypothetical protein [Vibrio ruber]SJN59081.1 hypothetical protein VR7878_03215 [Vibrio ruber DSM 16370]
MRLLKNIILYSLAFIGCLSLLFLSVVKVDNTNSFEKEIVSGILWIHAPDDSNGFKILSSEHPMYKMVIFNREKMVLASGEFLYKGHKMNELHLPDIIGFDGKYIHLKNNEYLECCNVKCD